MVRLAGVQATAGRESTIMLRYRGADSLHIGAMPNVTSTLLAPDAPPPVVSAGWP